MAIDFKNSMQLTIKQAKGSFFDKDAVLRRLKKGRATALKQAGYEVWKKAKGSLKKGILISARTASGKIARDADGKIIRTNRYKSSKDGKPPRMRANPLLKRLLFFAYDFGRDSVVAGSARASNQTVNGQTIPELMEYGGQANTTEFTDVGKFKTINGRKVNIKKKRRKQYKLKARPYMRPALNLAVEQGKIEKQFADIL